MSPSNLNITCVIQKFIQDRAFDEAITIVDNDKESDEEPYASEPIIKSAWNHANRMVHDPASVARSLPWDALHFNTGKSKLSYVDKLMKDSTVAWDSDVGFIKNSDSDNECVEKEEDEDLDDEEGGKVKPWVKPAAFLSLLASKVTGRMQAGSSKNDDSEWDEEQKNEEQDEQGESEESGQRNRLDGKQLYPDHYVDRFLPGVVYSHPVDNRPTNAIAWDKSVDSRIDIYWDL